MRFFGLPGLKEALVHIAGGAGGYALALLLSGQSTDAAAFGEVSAWWAALYAGFALSVTVRALPWLVVAYESVLLLDVVLNLRLFYSEGSSEAPLGYVALAQIGLPRLGCYLLSARS
jgi:hypothetical protein